MTGALNFWQFKENPSSSGGVKFEANIVVDQHLEVYISNSSDR